MCVFNLLKSEVNVAKNLVADNLSNCQMIKNNKALNGTLLLIINDYHGKFKR